VYISLPLYDFDVKLPSFTFYVEREIETTIFVFFFFRLSRPLEFNARKIRQHLKLIERDGTSGDPGKGPGEPDLPLFLDPTEARRAEKTLGRPAPPYLRIWMTAPAPYLKVWIRHCERHECKPPNRTVSFQRALSLKQGFLYILINYNKHRYFF